MQKPAKKLNLEKLIRKFQLTVLSGSSKVLHNTIIKKSGVEFGNFELLGVFLRKTKEKRILVWDKIEHEYMKSLPAQQQEVIFGDIIENKFPCVIITRNFNNPNFIKFAKKNDFPVFTTNAMEPDELISTLETYLAQIFLRYQTLHGTLMSIFGEGTLIVGESGLGKSEAAHELIKKKHLFVADDSVDYARDGRYIVGRPNPSVKNFLEVRGLGVLNIEKMFGVQSIMHKINITCVITLVEYTLNTEITRLRLEDESYILSSIKIPHYTIPVIPGRSVSELIESAVIDTKLRKKGYNSNKDFANHMNQLLESEND